MRFIVKEHQTESNNLISIIDEDLKNKSFEEGEKILDLTSNFYKGEIKTEEEVLNLIRKATHLNIVGKNIVKLLKEKDFIENIIEIDGVPCAQTIFVGN